MDAFNMWESNIVLFVQENLRFGFLDPVMKFITSLGDGGILPIAVIILFLLFKNILFIKILFCFFKSKSCCSKACKKYCYKSCTVT